MPFEYCVRLPAHQITDGNQESPHPHLFGSQTKAKNARICFSLMDSSTATKNLMPMWRISASSQRATSRSYTCAHGCDECFETLAQLVQHCTAQPSTCEGFTNEDLQIATESATAEWLLHLQGQVLFCYCGKPFRCCVRLAAHQPAGGNNRLQPNEASSQSTFLSGVPRVFSKRGGVQLLEYQHMHGFLTRSASEVASKSPNTSFLVPRPYFPIDHDAPNVCMIWRDSSQRVYETLWDDGRAYQQLCYFKTYSIDISATITLQIEAKSRTFPWVINPNTTTAATVVFNVPNLYESMFYTATLPRQARPCRFVRRFAHMQPPQTR